MRNSVRQAVAIGCVVIILFSTIGSTVALGNPAAEPSPSINHPGQFTQSHAADTTYTSALTDRLRLSALGQSDGSSSDGFFIDGAQEINSFGIQQDREIVKGGVYTARITVQTSKKGLFQEFQSTKISSPELSIKIAGDGAEIISTSSTSYNPNNCAFPTSTCTIESTTPFGTGETHQVTVLFRVPRDSSAEEVTFSATPNNEPTQSVTLPVTESANAIAAQAELARTKANIGAAYDDAYRTILDEDSLQEQSQKSLRRGFSVTANEVATSATTGYADQGIAVSTSAETANNLETVQNARTSYELVTTESGEVPDSSFVGQVAPFAVDALDAELQAGNVQRIENRANTSYAINEYIRLSEQQAKAWENGNRDRVREILNKKLYVLTGTGPNSGFGSKYRDQYQGPSTYLQPGEAPSLSRLSGIQKGAATSAKRKAFFGHLQQFAQKEAAYIRGTSRPLTKSPTPRIKLRNSQKNLQTQLAQGSGTVTVEFIVSNGASGGPTSRQGYLSFSYANTLELSDVDKVSDGPSPTVTNISAGEEVNTRNGSTTTATHKLTDVYEQYDTGETNVYRVTFEKTGEAWIAYRAAFKPLLFDQAGSDSFARFPLSNRADGVDQQNIPVFNVTSKSTGTDAAPSAGFDISQNNPSVGETVTVDTSLSGDDDGITNRQLSVSNNADVTRDGSQYSVTFNSPGRKTVSLSVTDTAGQKDETSTTVFIQSSELDPFFQANRSVITTGEAVQLRSATSAEQYRWDLDGDGAFNDASGATALWTPSENRSYTVRLQVSTGGTQASVEQSFIVESARAQFFSPNVVLDTTGDTSLDEPISPGEEIQLDASTSTDLTLTDDGTVDSGEITEYRWDIDDDGTAEQTGPEVTFSYESSGQRTLTLTLVDADGNTATTSRIVNVSSDGEQPPSDPPSDSPVTSAPDCSNISYDGSGTEFSPYLIANINQLQCIENQGLDNHYQLTSDINANGTVQWNNRNGFNPIGSSNNSFTGSLDGNNQVIVNLTVARADESHVGLFASNDGKITGININGIDLRGSNTVGGLAGANTGSISDTTVSGTVTAGDVAGGLVGSNYAGTISNTSVNVLIGDETVGTGGNIGGLIGNNTRGTVSNVSASGSVRGDYRTGGLIGINTDGTVSGATANVSVAGGNEVGGLVGTNEGSISNASASVSVTGNNRVGGLIGENGGLRTPYVSDVSNVTVSGSVKGGNDVGGLIGNNFQESVSNAVANVSVNGSEAFTNRPSDEVEAVGGLVGLNSRGTISNSTARGPVSGYIRVGGLVGENDGLAAINQGTIVDSTASGSVDGVNSVGGLIGYNNGATISNTTVSGKVNASESVGGLIGLNYGPVSNATASSSVNGYERVGGLIGENDDDVTEVTASGPVNGSNNVGGLIGANGDALVSNATARGSVNGSDNVGGLVGINTRSGVNDQISKVGNTRQIISESFATGNVAGDNSTGGLVGQLGSNRLKEGGKAVIRDSYYDAQTTGQSMAVGEIKSGNGTTETRGETQGLETGQMQGQSASSNMDTLDFRTAWRVTVNPDDYPVRRTGSVMNSNRSTPGPDDNTSDIISLELVLESNRIEFNSTDGATASTESTGVESVTATFANGSKQNTTDNNAISFRTSDKDIVSIGSNPVNITPTGQQAGTATIEATLQNATAVANLTVVRNVRSQIQNDSVTFGENETGAVEEIEFNTDEDIAGQPISISESDQPNQNATAIIQNDSDISSDDIDPIVSLNVQNAPNITDADDSETAIITTTIQAANAPPNPDENLTVIRVPDEDGADPEELDPTVTNTTGDNLTVEFVTPGFSSFILSSIDSGGQTDNSGNNDDTTTAGGGDDDGDTGGGSSAGSGGESSITRGEASLTDVRPAADGTTVAFPGNDIDEITFATEDASGSVFVEESETLPSSAPPLSENRPVVGVVDISVPDELDNTSATIVIELPVERFNAVGLAPEDAIVLHGTNSGYETLPTSVEVDEGVVSLTVETDGFSPFVVTNAQQTATPTDEATPTPTDEDNEPAPEPTATPTDEPGGGETASPTSAEQLGFGVAVAVVALLVAVVIAARRRDN